MKAAVRRRLESSWSIWHLDAEAFVRFMVNVADVDERDVREFLDEPAHPEDDDE